MSTKLSDKKRPRIIIIISLAYSGTTWLSLVISSHLRAMSLGAGDMLFERLQGSPGELCGIHGDKCEFWPGFLKQRQQNKDFFLDLSEYSGKDVFVIQNPSRYFLDQLMQNKDVDLCFIHNIRDGKATLASAMKHHPERVDSVFQSCCAWLYRGTKNLHKRLAALEKESLLVRYEDAVSNPVSVLEKISDWTGVDYDLKCLEFWQHKHHIPSGNVGVLDLLRKLQGEVPVSIEETPFYANLYEAAREGSHAVALDDSWKDVYNEVDLAAYDWAAGKLYEEYGYPRSQYSEQAYEKFIRLYNPPETIEEAIASFPPWRRPVPLRKRINATGIVQLKQKIFSRLYKLFQELRFRFLP